MMAAKGYVSFLFVTKTQLKIAWILLLFGPFAPTTVLGCEAPAPTPAPPPPSVPATIGATTLKACIDGGDLVRTPNGVKRVEDLALGDKVAVSKDDKGYVFEEVITFLHRDKSKKAPGFKFTTSAGRQITLSHEHLVLLAPDKRSIFAKHVKLGDVLYTVSSIKEGSSYNTEEIVRIEKTSLQGRYSPVTKSGTIIVNDILISCYSHKEDHELMHFIVHWILFKIGYDKSFEADGLWGRQDGLHTFFGPVWHFFRRYFVG